MEALYLIPREIALMNGIVTIEPAGEWGYSSASTVPLINVATSYLTADPVLSVPFITFDLTEPEPLRKNGEVPALSKALQRVAELEHLQADWDSYGGAPPTHDALEAARDLISKVAQQLPGAEPGEIVPFAIAPISGGGVQLEWRRGEDAIEVEISADAHYGFLYISGIGDRRRFEELDNVTESEVLNRVLSVVRE